MDAQVNDPFGVRNDPQLPTLALALNPATAQKAFKRLLPKLARDPDSGDVKVRAIRVARHKPGRRCVVEYDLRIHAPDVPPEPLTLIGKVRVRRYGNADYRRLQAVWNAGFRSDSTDGLSVPEPVGVVPKFRMWLQRKVPGELATSALLRPDGVELAARVAEAAHKLHRANVPTDRRHGMKDELNILHEHVPLVARARPGWRRRLERILAGCDELGASVAESRRCGIHRDFYSNQVIVGRTRVWLLDFDLYCQGDPALDIGNFMGHLTEQSLRTLGDPNALADRERAMENRFVELAGERIREAVRVYATLTLVRHIYLSSRFPERVHLTERLVELCEQRLKLARRW
jgi:hypothetical protein